MQTVENFAKLISGEKRSIDPALSYKGCSFEPYNGKYAYTCKGRGKNIYGSKKFVETTAMSSSRNETPGSGGGVYYGLPVDLDKDPKCVFVPTFPLMHAYIPCMPVFAEQKPSSTR